MSKEISVVLPVYNGMPYVRESVESVLQQTAADFEFLIVDDCSTDKDCWQYLTSITDSRIKLFRNQNNKGLFPNLNFLISQSEAPLIKLWSQDDVMYPGCLQKIIQFHKQHSGLGFSYSGRDFINESGTVTGSHQNDPTPEIISKELHAAIAFYTGSIAGNIANVTLSRPAINTCGLFNETMKISGDFEMWVRLSLHYPIGFIKENVIQLRNHDQQLSRQEQFYIYHMKEDFSTYEILFKNLTPVQQGKGRKLLRRSKLMFYYTLMCKSFLKGKFNTGWQFMRTLHQFDNIFLLTLLYAKTKIMGRPALQFREL